MIEQILINAFAIIGLYAVSRDGFLLEYGRKFIEWLPVLHWIQKPLITCVLCMSSIWGATYFLFNDLFIVQLIAHVLAVAGFIHFLANFSQLMKEATSYLDLAKLDLFKEDIQETEKKSSNDNDN